MENYKNAISKVLKQLHPSLSLSSDVKDNINIILNRLCEKLVKECLKLMKPQNFTNSGKKLPQKMTLSVLEAETATKLVFDKVLGEHGVSEGLKAVTKFKDASENISPSKRVKLQFPISKTKNIIQKNILKNDSLSPLAVVFITAVLEYTCAEILELSGNNCMYNKRKRINSNDMKKAIINDIELEHLISNVLQISLTGEIAAIKKKRFGRITFTPIFL